MPPTLCRFCRPLFAALALAVATAPTLAEPYLAVRAGAHCSACHLNPTGGGLRTNFGTAYGIGQLPAEAIDGAADWTGSVGGRLRVGGDLRVNLSAVDAPNRDEEYAFGRDEALLYAEFALLPDRLSFYVDQRVAPGTALNREAYLFLRSPENAWHLKAGRLFAPYGLRLEDDSAYTRQFTGISMASSDDGIEVGWQRGPGAVQLAVTNGNGGGAENNKGKQWSLHATHVAEAWRVGVGYNFNDGVDRQDRSLSNLYLGLRTGPVAWLAEADYIVDDTFPTGRRKQALGLVEANLALARGHNLKLTYEYFDPDTRLDEDQRNRGSLVWEYTPIPFLQVRTGFRVSDGIPQNDLENQKEAFLQLHLYF